MSDEDQAREESSKLMYAEALRLRDLQDGRLGDMRQRSMTLLSYVTAAITLVIGFAADHDFHPAAALVAIGSIVGMVVAAVCVQSPKNYCDGPDIAALASGAYEGADPLHRVRRDLATYHYEHFLSNEKSAVSRSARALKFQMALAGIATVAIVIGFSF